MESQIKNLLDKLKQKQQSHITKCKIYEEEKYENEDKTNDKLNLHIEIGRLKDSQTKTYKEILLND